MAPGRSQWGPENHGGRLGESLYQRPISAGASDFPRSLSSSVTRKPGTEQSRGWYVAVRLASGPWSQPPGSAPCSPSLWAPKDAEPDGGRAGRHGGRVALAGQYPAQREPLLWRQPHHRAVGPHRSTLLLQVSGSPPALSPKRPEQASSAPGTAPGPMGLWAAALLPSSTPLSATSFR